MSSIAALRDDFPALKQLIRGKPLSYLDSAASAQKPQYVIDVINQVYSHDYSNVHRGVHTLSERATVQFENARETVQQFIHAKENREIIFVRGVTEAINLVAQTYGKMHIGQGDEILISEMEHHANIVPWQLLCEQTGASLKVIPITDVGEIDQTVFEQCLNARTKLLAITHISNALGTINPIKIMIDKAHAYGIPVLIDGAQGAVHTRVDVQALDCDFYTFSGHKCYGPTGIGVLYGKAALLEQMPPYQGGGEMISQVSFEKTTYAPIPQKFEAGTPHIAGAIGLAAACDYLNNIDYDALHVHEADLLDYATQALSALPNIRLIGTAKDKAGIVAFVSEKVHPHDIGTILDHEGVAVRTGHHCAMPLMQRYHVPATVRASFGLYNNKADVDALINGLAKVETIFK